MATLRDEVMINGMRLRNRVALPPLTTNYGSPDGLVTDGIIQFYGERSKDVGLVIVEATAVRSDGRIVQGSLGLWEDGQVAGMARLADAIKKSGAAAVVEISHAGARCFPGGGEMEGASPSAGFAFRPDVTPFNMSLTQIDSMVSDFAAAVGRAADAGFDGVEIHGAHFYLISQFLSPLTNQRNDRYGGDARGRATFALEVVRAARERLGRDYPILFRLNAVEKVEGGQTLEDALVVSRLLADEGVDALDVSLITQGSWREVDDRRFLVPASAFPKDEQAGANVPLAAKVKEASGLPVIAVGKLGDGPVAAESVHDSLIDVVAIGRQMIADPDSAGKILAGKDSEIIPCEECMTCFASLGKGIPMVCKVNRNLPGVSPSP
ncbi:MAG: NADH:flavin oxidoreductase [Deltaproteobacteria bacterium]|uniref:NADH:flavin oxidoreductase n=1 Tax=Candidatus Desulfacyla euxinica TaxID=2841693 RepID=A0A8J6MYT2_9DELT|nr:NADH:flavin oxidoreductase [Candidatus Desulfacyla euxinica]MBL7217930.1 NADH:flavin oxidoreductase [Desulfobacteraceae bacterium]